VNARWVDWVLTLTGSLLATAKALAHHLCFAAACPVRRDGREGLACDNCSGAKVVRLFPSASNAVLCIGITTTHHRTSTIALDIYTWVWAPQLIGHTSIPPRHQDDHNLGAGGKPPRRATSKAISSVYWKSDLDNLQLHNPSALLHLVDFGFRHNFRLQASVPACWLPHATRGIPWPLYLGYSARAIPAFGEARGEAANALKPVFNFLTICRLSTST
jgi:hypothetical protein